MNSNKKHIACLESLWDNGIEHRLNVGPILELITKLYKVKHIHLTCNTVQELEFNLDLLRHKHTYPILYLAFHGNPGNIWLANNEMISLEQLTEMMGTRFSGWIIHFCTCQTIRVNETRLGDFMRATDISMIVGYDANVDWIESSTMDLLLLGKAQDYKNMASLRKMLLSRYRDLVVATGLQLYLKTDFS